MFSAISGRTMNPETSAALFSTSVTNRVMSPVVGLGTKSANAVEDRHSIRAISTQTIFFIGHVLLSYYMLPV